jgi:sugar phosphate isomerase/epimerase
MSRFVLGMPTMAELPDLESNVELARGLGLGLVELNMNLPQYCPQGLPAERLRQAADVSGLTFTLHLPEEIDLASFQPAIRQGNLACCIEAIRWCGQARIALANLHLAAGVYFTLPDRRMWLYEEHLPTFIENLRVSFAALMAAAQENGVTVCLENAGRFQMKHVQQAVGHLLGVHPDLRLTWDVGHDAAAGWLERPVFEKHRGRIGHLHLHDCDGRESHRVLFTGNVDVAATLDLARALDTAVVIEVKTPASLTESVRRLDERGLGPQASRK